LRQSRTSRPWQPTSALSGSDGHDFAVSQGLDIANWALRAVRSQAAKIAPRFLMKQQGSFKGFFLS
jgi:hypothetical protein